MNSDFIKQCGNSSELCYFLFKNYGLELLFLLEEFEANEIDNGIDDTYDAIQFFKPRRAAFRSYCVFLRDKNAIVYLIFVLEFYLHNSISTFPPILYSESHQEMEL